MGNVYSELEFDSHTLAYTFPFSFSAMIPLERTSIKTNSLKLLKLKQGFCPLISIELTVIYRSPISASAIMVI